MITQADSKRARTTGFFRCNFNITCHTYNTVLIQKENLKNNQGIMNGRIHPFFDSSPITA